MEIKSSAQWSIPDGVRRDSDRRLSRAMQALRCDVDDFITTQLIKAPKVRIFALPRPWQRPTLLDRAEPTRIRSRVIDGDSQIYLRDLKPRNSLL